MHDTSPDVLHEWNRRFHDSTAMQRLERSFALMNAARTFAESAIRARYPDADEPEFRRELARYLYGDAIAAMVMRHPSPLKPK